MRLRIKEVAKEKGVTMVLLAEKIGIAQPSMSNIATGKTTPSLDTLEKIANALGVAVSELIDELKSNTITCPHCGKPIKFEKGE